MAEYGYTYRSYSAYSTVSQERRGPDTKPFSSFVPKTNGNSEGCVTKKTVVPVTSGPYGDDYKSHEAYPYRDDDEWHRQTSPVHGSPREVDEFHNKEASRPQRFGPKASTDWHQSLKPTAYNGANGYGGDYGNNKERYKPIGSPIKNDNYDGYRAPNGYGGYNKNGEHKPTGLPIRNDHHDGYNVPDGHDGYNKREGRKPTGLPMRNGNYDGSNGPNGYGGYNKKDNHKPTSLPIRNDNYDDDYNVPGGYGGYNKKEGHKPMGFPIWNDSCDGYNGPDGYNKKEGHKSTVLPTRKDNYDGYSCPNYNGYGNGNGNYDDNHYGYNNKEGHKPRGDGGWSRPKISPGWTASPRKGTQLSEPTHDIEKAMELLKMEAAKHNNGKNHGDLTRKFDKDMELVKETEKLKNIVTGYPQSNKDDYVKSIERSRDATTKPFVNMNHSLRPRTSPTSVTVFDGRDGDYRDDTRGGYGQPSVMDSKVAEKLFKGANVS